jgi:hypothetical protein
MNKFKEITYKQLKALRKKQWLKQNKECPILKKKIVYKDAVMDHKHKRKDEKIGKDGKGLLRGVLHFQANTIEGKIVNMYKRYGLHKLIDLPSLLRNISDYLLNPPMEQKYVHPKERPKPKKLGKREYKRICKYYFEVYPRRRKLPKYPKSGVLTKECEIYITDIDKYLKDKS